MEVAYKPSIRPTKQSYANFIRRMSGQPVAYMKKEVRYKSPKHSRTHLRSSSNGKIRPKKKRTNWLYTSSVFMKVVALASLGLLIWQLADLSMMYLKYSTLTSIQLKINPTTRRQATSICFLYNDVLVPSLLEERYPDFYELYMETGRLSLDDTSANFTVADIFDLTPSIDEVSH